MTRPALRRAALHGGTAVVLAAALTLPAAVAHAQTSGSDRSGAADANSVTVLLSSADPSALSTLANTPGLTSRQRTERLAAVLPDASGRSTVIATLTARGLHVESSTPWSITATGSTSTIDALNTGTFGTAASAVVGGSDNTPIVRPLDTTLTGSDFRSLYSTSSAGPQGSNTPLTIATLQFSGWDDDWLSRYADDNSLPDPVADGQYTPVKVGDGDPNQPDGSGGDLEVALDQESLLSTAPTANQRAYFAENSPEGFVDGIEAVTKDASAHHIAALSISWGECEQAWGSANINAVHTALKQALAAGVTVFASSGDDGAAGCFDGDGSTADAVDYPASDPYVIGVGGTTVNSTSPASESVWNSDTPKDPRFGASGGGVSTIFARPGFQHNATSSSKRAVPDIAADADPTTGFRVTTIGTNTTKLPTTPVGGTSLASPVSTGLFVDTLEARGHQQGIGNVLSRLYDAPASAFRDVTSGVSGTNGHAATVGYDEATGRGSVLWSTLGPYLDDAPALAESGYVDSRTIPLHVQVPAGVSYTTWRAGTGARPACSGLPDDAALPSSVKVTKDGNTQVWVEGVTSASSSPASACYSATASVDADTVRPKAHTSVGLTSATSGAHITAHWTASDAASGVGAVTIKVYRLGHSAPVATLHATKSGSKSIASVQGSTYRTSVVVTDRAGNDSSAATAQVAVPLNDTKLVIGGGAWFRHSSSHAYGGEYLASDERGSSARWTADGSQYTLLMTTCSTCGKVAVYLGGTRVRTIDLYSASTRYRVAFSVGSRSFGSHTVKLEVLGTHRHASHGANVRVDALRVTR